MRAVQRIYEVVFGAERIIETLQYGGFYSFTIKQNVSLGFVSSERSSRLRANTEKYLSGSSYCLGRRTVTLIGISLSFPIFSIFE